MAWAIIEIVMEPPAPEQSEFPGRQFTEPFEYGDRVAAIPANDHQHIGMTQKQPGQDPGRPRVERMGC